MKNDNLELRNRLLNLYKRLLLAMKSEYEIMDLYIEYIKIMLEYDTILPTFKRFPKGQIFGNFYTYALDINCPLMFQSLFTMRTLFSSYLGLNFNVGFISDVNNRTRTSVYDVQDLLDKFYVYVTDFYDALNKESETLCYQEFGSSKLSDIQELRTIIGKRFYAVPLNQSEMEEDDDFDDDDFDDEDTEYKIVIE